MPIFKQCNESITTLKCGRVNSPYYDEIVVSTYGGDHALWEKGEGAGGGEGNHPRYHKNLFGVDECLKDIMVILYHYYC